MALFQFVFSESCSSCSSCQFHSWQVRAVPPRQSRCCFFHFGADFPALFLLDGWQFGMVGLTVWGFYPLLFTSLSLAIWVAKRRSARLQSSRGTTASIRYI